MRDTGVFLIEFTASLTSFFLTLSSWPEFQRLALPLWIHTHGQHRAGEKNDMMPSVIRTFVELRSKEG